MLIKYYKVIAINDLAMAMQDKKLTKSWLITAGDLPSAWRKFKRQYFGDLQPNPADYDIAFSHSKSV